VAGLFEEQVTLIPLETWLPAMFSGPQRNRGRYTQIQHLINDLLPAECRFTAKMEQSSYVFEMRGSEVPFAALSDGYRAYIGWITDLLYHIMMGTASGSKLRDSRGIVLVDEIDLHLHPEWQRTVVPTLAKALPNLQFVITSHSPIVAGTLQSDNIFVTVPDQQGASVIQQAEERIHGLSAEQILLSPYFGLRTTRAPEMVDHLEALAMQAWSGDASDAEAYLRQLVSGLEDDAEIATRPPKRASRKASAPRRRTPARRPAR
jgi:hypothetical protein